MLETPQLTAELRSLSPFCFLGRLLFERLLFMRELQKKKKKDGGWRASRMTMRGILRGGFLPLSFFFHPRHFADVTIGAKRVSGSEEGFAYNGF